MIEPQHVSLWMHGSGARSMGAPTAAGLLLEHSEKRSKGECRQRLKRKLVKDKEQREHQPSVTFETIYL